MFKIKTKQVEILASFFESIFENQNTYKFEFFEIDMFQNASESTRYHLYIWLFFYKNDTLKCFGWILWNKTSEAIFTNDEIFDAITNTSTHQNIPKKIFSNLHDKFKTYANEQRSTSTANERN